MLFNRFTTLSKLLPVKPLDRFRCVRNPFSSQSITNLNPPTTIDAKNGSFINTNSRYLLFSHADQEKNLSFSHSAGHLQKMHYSLHLDDDTPNSPNLELDFPFHTDYNPYFRVVGTCDGLICLTDDALSVMHTVILWNPILKMSVTLPWPNVTFGSHGPFEHVMGFGFDPKTNDYKVVRLTHLDSNGSFFNPPSVEVYSLGAGSWRSIDARPRFKVRHKEPHVLFNGDAHWIALDLDNNCNKILAFDFADEVFREMSLPEGLAPYLVRELSISVFGESLTVFQYGGGKVSSSIWVMKEYGVVESWSELCITKVGETWQMPLGFRSNGEVLLATTDGKMVSYDLETQKEKDIGLRGVLRPICVHPYMPSSVLPEEGKGVSRA